MTAAPAAIAPPRPPTSRQAQHLRDTYDTGLAYGMPPARAAALALSTAASLGVTRQSALDVIRDYSATCGAAIVLGTV